MSTETADSGQIINKTFYKIKSNKSITVIWKFFVKSMEFLAGSKNTNFTPVFKWKYKV